MTITSQDEHLLDLLTDPSTIRVRLARSLSTGTDATDDNAARRTDNHFIEEVGRAFFWASQDNGKNQREFQGEIDVAKSLKPSFKFPKFTVRVGVDWKLSSERCLTLRKYTVDLQPFMAPGIVNTAPETTILSSLPVSIMSKPIADLQTRSYAPPGYRKVYVDYNKSVGLLENGNQRFLGHHHAS